jgi:MFS family permease
MFLRVPEPPSATASLLPGETVISTSFKRLRGTLQDIHQYRELFKYLIAFLVYNDGIGTIIGVAAIYGAELGFGSVELILALLLVQFVGIPYSLIFGRLPSRGEKRRPVYLAFVLFNLLALPLIGLAGARLLPATISGAPPAAYASTDSAVGQGVYPAGSDSIHYLGQWQTENIPAALSGTGVAETYAAASAGDARLELPFNGQQVKITFSLGPDHGIWIVQMDGAALLDPDTGETQQIDGYNETTRYGESRTFQASAPGEHVLSLVNTAQRDPQSTGSVIALASIEVLPPVRHANLWMIILLIAVLELAGLALSFLVGKPLFTGLAERMDTRRSILLALIVYTVIAIWGYFLNSVIEFWFLAWMVAIVQGGSQALSRSLYASMSPAAKSGEFFGLFGVMEKFSAIIGPLLFAAAGVIFGSSRPAVLSLIALFFIGGSLLLWVNVAEGRRIAQREDAELLQEGAEA